MNEDNEEKTSKKEALMELTEGVLLTVTEIVLAELFFGLSLLFAGSYSGSVYRASREADKALEEALAAITSKSVKRTCNQLKHQGYITYVRGKTKKAKLTKTGFKRIKNVLPQYKTERPWDNKLYTITYDVPENRRQNRDLLREVLKRSGCGLLQQSVWITPYNPQEMLEAAVRDYKIVGDIIVSDTGKEGNIGKTNFKELISRVYDLKKINDRYAEFIKKCHNKRRTREQLVFKFLSIAGDDPQLPYELLPKDWLGDEAHLLFKRIADSV